ncbi:MAG: carboxylating nicotinate-nucleotide diphosphorylase [Planctomycetes bacterium]|nr:carboxylating nicotinate-nucleotide diphosphorylase [Planctomycetota bacterium]
MDWNNDVEQDCRALIRLAVQEDLGGQQDWTTVALVPDDRQGAAEIVAREAGVVAGLRAIDTLVNEMRAKIVVDLAVSDGDQIQAGARLATLSGNVRDLLTCERPLLNLLARLMGIATMARRFVDEVEGTGARVYDTRKTTPGWRRLEKYAARCGGACNHRTGLFDAILIKDNHLAQRAAASSDVAAAVKDARNFLKEYRGAAEIDQLLVEVEVDTLDQLSTVLPAGPDIVLLDNMPAAKLREAVKMRDSLAPNVELEASGGVCFETLREIAGTGVERISVGALTHSVRSLDIGLDWKNVS